MVQFEKIMGKQLILKDPIYGEFIIDSPVIVELIHSAPIKRLKNIAQYGIPDEFYFLKNFSRYDHSIGTMLLLKKLGATEKEQIAGLLHDVSHTAFSHVIDWVVGVGGNEEYQDNSHKDFILGSDIKNILTKYDINPLEIIDYKNFQILERPAPQVCADRVDYMLRELSSNDAQKIVSNIIVRKNKIIFISKKSAFYFANQFLDRQMNHWGSFEAASRYRIFADILKKAIDLKVIAFDDFWKDDPYIVTKLKTSKDKTIKDSLKILRYKSLKNLPLSTKIVYKKFRYVDPEYTEKATVKKLSQNDKKFAKILEAARSINKKGVIIPLTPDAL